MYEDLRFIITWDSLSNIPFFLVGNTSSCCWTLKVLLLTSLNINVSCDAVLDNWCRLQQQRLVWKPCVSLALVKLLYILVDLKQYNLEVIHTCREPTDWKEMKQCLSGVNDTFFAANADFFTVFGSAWTRWWSWLWCYVCPVFFF